MLYQYLLGMAGNEKASLYDCEQEFRKKFASMNEDDFSRKWGATKHFLKELVNVEKPEYTKLIRVTSTWGIPGYHVYELNMSPLKHNKELIKLLLAISAVWDLSFGIEERRVDVTEAIDATFKVLESQKDYKGIYDAFYKDDVHQSYIYIQNKNIPLEVHKHGPENMGMKVWEIDVLMY